MTFPTATKDAGLNAQAFTHASLHTGFPGTTGLNEVTGGAPAYARKAIVINASSGGARTLNATVTFDVPASTIRWVGFWNVNTFLFAVPNGGGLSKNFSVILATDTVVSTAHGYPDGQKIVFFGKPPVGLTEGTTYFVRDSADDTFKVCATLAGTAIDLTAGASSGCWVAAITETVYAAQDTHSLTGTNYAWPD